MSQQPLSEKDNVPLEQLITRRDVARAFVNGIVTMGQAKAGVVGSLASVALAACGGGGGDKTTEGTLDDNSDVSGSCRSMGDTVSAQCVGGAPVGTPNAPVPPVINPPVNNPPVAAPGATAASKSFTSLGLNVASVTASMGMMSSLTIATTVGTVPVWVINGASGGFNDDRIVPGPVIELTQGQAASITLRNASMLPHTIHPHGLDVNTQNDGVPQTSFAVQPMGSYAYQFIAPFAGTYLYHCHVDAALHFEMGMYGAVIVRPASGSTSLAWDGGPSFSREYIWQLHTFDTRWHTTRQSGPQTQRYRPDVFMINGRDGAATQSDTTTAISATQGSRVLLRVICYGYMPTVVDLGGVLFDVIASDGRPLPAPIVGQTTWRITPGERYDLLLTMPAAGVRTATVGFQNIRGSAVIGTAQTTITSV